MKLRKLLIVLLLAVPVGSTLRAVAPVEAVAAAKEIKTVVFRTKLHCQNCCRKVEENISFVKGVKDLRVSLENQEITVKYDASKTTAEKLAAEIRSLGYPAEIKK